MTPPLTLAQAHARWVQAMRARDAADVALNEGGLSREIYNLRLQRVIEANESLAEAEAALLALPSAPQEPPQKPPADAKEWTCPTCGGDSLWCTCSRPETVGVSESAAEGRHRVVPSGRDSGQSAVPQEPPQEPQCKGGIEGCSGIGRPSCMAAECMFGAEVCSVCGNYKGLNVACGFSHTVPQEPQAQEQQGYADLIASGGLPEAQEAAAKWEPAPSPLSAEALERIVRDIYGQVGFDWVQHGEAVTRLLTNALSTAPAPPQGWQPDDCDEPPPLS